MPMSILLATDEALAKFDGDLLKTYVPGATPLKGKATDTENPVTSPVGIPAPLLKKYTRPSGEVYLPRSIKIGDTAFKDVALIEQAYDKALSVLLYGPPGTGKTALIEAALDNVVTVQGSIETERADFEGSWVQQPDGTYAWVDGPLLVAADEGRPLLIDEIALIDPRQLSVVYSMMDGRNEITVTMNPERGVVKAKPGFMVFGATNPDVPGAVMSEALLSRFAFHVEMKTDWTVAKNLGVPTEIIQVARNLETKAKTGIVGNPPQLREVLAFRDIEKAFGLEVALHNFVGQARPEDREYVTEAIGSVYGKKAEALAF